MRDHTAHHRRMKYVFSADKHWVFILLIASNFVLLSLVFVIFNQDYGLFSSKSLLPKEDFYTTTISNDQQNDQVLVFDNYTEKISLDFNRVFNNLIRFTKNTQNINEYYKEYSFEPSSTFKLSVLEYVVGQKYDVSTQVGTASAKKVTYEMDKQVKWLSSLDSGLQKTIKYDPSVKNPLETTVLAKKIGKLIYYVNDYLSPQRTWVREYMTYDIKDKQLIKITFITNEKSISGQKVPEYTSATLKTLGKIEGIISSESNKAE